MSRTSLKPTLEWKKVNWKQLERQVFKLQKRIYKASSRGEVKKVRRLQKLLVKSWSAKMLAVRRVTQDNKGKKTAGVDGVKSLSPKARMSLVGQLKFIGKSHPTRRVWIDKVKFSPTRRVGTDNPVTIEKRPLGIPTMSDRALQSLAKMALEPEWESKFEPNSYGFRPGRSCHDAIGQLFKELLFTPKYILDADISKCFDRINHETLLKKINTYPKMRKQIKAWLKAGVMDNGILEKTEAGTPQGGVLSPLLANIALHGMETHIRDILGDKKAIDKKPHLIRYADDIIILHKDIAVINKCSTAIEAWLKPLGLELNQSKTRICHSLNQLGEEKPGFNFLGFNIRQYTCGKAKSITHNGKKLGYQLHIKPSKESIKAHLLKIREVIKSHKSSKQSALIGKLNPIIKGWTNYYSSVISKEIFSYCDSKMWQKLRTWSKYRHCNKSTKWLKNKYWKTINGRKVFATREDETGYKLNIHADTPIIRFVKVQNTRSPYDGDWVYWSSRMGRSPDAPSNVARLLKEQKGKCLYCDSYFNTEDIMEIDHIIPKYKGGKNKRDNLQLLHRHCHDSKSAEDGSSERCTDDNSCLTEEPCEVKISSTVLKTSRRGDSSA